MGISGWVEEPLAEAGGEAEAALDSASAFSRSKMARRSASRSSCCLKSVIWWRKSGLEAVEASRSGCMASSGLRRYRAAGSSSRWGSSRPLLLLLLLLLPWAAAASAGSYMQLMLSGGILVIAVGDGSDCGGSDTGGRAIDGLRRQELS